MPRRRRNPEPQPELIRLVKTLQPVALVREMDQTILASAGVYAGRDDFIAEAIRDRIAEESARQAGGGPAPIVLLEDVRAADAPAGALGFAVLPHGIAVLPPVNVSEGLYGLHNRDYPTLWGAASLASMVAANGEPISWVAYRARVVNTAWNVGAQLAKLDEERPRGTMKAAIGFPLHRDKGESAESRFAEHMLGHIRTDGSPRGPLFVLGLAGLDPSDRDERDPRVAPTPPALELLGAVTQASFSARPPHAEKAWLAFGRHVRTHAAAEYRAWMDVLEAVEAEVPRERLVQGFRERWPGSAADTNVYGYISRAREWGLIEAQLAEGEHRLTDRGVRALQEVGRT